MLRAAPGRACRNAANDGTLASRRGLRIAIVLALVLAMFPAASMAAPSCPSDCGDCSDNFEVTIDELIACVNQALAGGTDVCSTCDVDRSGAVMVSDLIEAVRVSLGEPDLRKVEGTCHRPCLPEGCSPAAEHGLEPCADSMVLVWRCTDAGECVQATTVEMDHGNFCFGMCRFQPPVLRIQDDGTTYRSIRIGPAGVVPDASAATRGAPQSSSVADRIDISPNSEALVRLVEQHGIAAFDAMGLSEVAAAIEQANRGTDFGGLDPAQAANLATQTASSDPQVTDAIERGLGIAIRIGQVSTRAGSTVGVDVSLSTGGTSVAATQNDLLFPPEARVPATTRGGPDCQVNPEIHKQASTFGFLPVGCDPTRDCTGVRALVLDLADTDPIPNRSILYTCQLAVEANAAGTFPLSCANSLISPPEGGDVSAQCTAGAVAVM